MKGISKFLLTAVIMVLAVCSVFVVCAFAAEDDYFEAYVGENGYISLIDALDSAENGSTVSLNKNVTLPEVYVVEEGRTITIDLNGQALTVEEGESSYAIANLGNLTMMDSRGNGSVTARGIYNGYDGSDIYDSNATITVLSGTYNAIGRSSGSAIFNYGVANISGGTFTSIGYYALNNRSEMTVENATVTGGIYCKGTLNITNSTITNKRAGANVIYATNSRVTINSGNFRNEVDSSATIMSSSSTVTVNGGEFTIGSTYYLIDGVGYVINGGSFDGAFRTNDRIVINGGNFSNSNASASYSVRDAVISGGVFNGAELISFASSKLAEGYFIDANGRVSDSPPITVAVAKIGDVEYSSLEGAIFAVKEGEVITLISDLDIDYQLVIAKGTVVVIDLAGYEINHTHTASEGYSFITNYGALTITDSSEAKSGKITYSELGDADSVSLIDNRGGALTVNGGTLTLASGSASNVATAFVINNYNADGDTLCAVNGGKLVNENSYSIHQLLASETCKNDLVINGGKFVGAVWTQSANSGELLGSITVNGGEFTPNENDDAAIYITTVDSKSITASVCGGIFNGKICVDNTANISGFISGGTFTSNAMANTVSALLAADAEFVQNGDGSYGILIVNYKGIVLDGSKYNLTTSTSFIGNLYIKVPSADAGYAVEGYDSVRVIEGERYYVFTSSPVINNITANIIFNITVEFDGAGDKVITASFTTDSYFAAVMASHARVEAPTESQIADMKLIMNATYYANELYKYINGSSYANYDAILENADYAKYITSIDDVDFIDEAKKDNSSINDVVSSAGLKIHDSYFVSFVFYVTGKYDEVKSVSVSYTALDGQKREQVLTLENSVINESIVYYLEAGNVAIYDMLSVQTVTVEYADGSIASGEYNLAAYVNAQIQGATVAKDLAKAIYAYAEASASFKLIVD